MNYTGIVIGQEKLVALSAGRYHHTDCLADGRKSLCLDYPRSCLFFLFLVYFGDIRAVQTGQKGLVSDESEKKTRIRVKKNRAGNLDNSPKLHTFASLLRKRPFGV